MTRKQITIPGTERPDHPEIEEAALAYVAVRDERMSLKRAEADKKALMGQLMKQAKIKAYKFYDQRAGVYRVARIEPGEESFVVEQTDEGIPEVGSGVAAKEEKRAGEQGLIDQALADSANNVEVTDDGDVTVPDKAAPKKARKKKS